MFDAAANGTLGSSKEAGLCFPRSIMVAHVQVRAVVSVTSNTPQSDVGNYSCFYIRLTA